jgi:glycosyltransferase involved in cell wall biosynthesis
MLKEEKFDLVHVDMLPLTAYIDEFAKLPKILVNHNVESLRLYRWFRTEKNPVKKMYLGFQYLKLRRYEAWAMNHYDACVVVSEEDCSILKGMGIKSKTFVVPNGTDTEYFKPTGEDVDKDSIIWLGHMDVHTNRDAAVYLWNEILPIIWESYPGAKMKFVGTSPPKEISDAALLDRRVEATGFVDDIRDYVKKAVVVVVPIRIGSGTRLKILDAMGMSKAIVSTSVGCEGLNVRNDKNILIADSPKEFADSVVRVLKSDELRLKLEKNARKIALEYDWKYQSAIQEQVYKYAVGR